MRTRTWTYFLPAAFFASFLLISKGGAPLGPVLLGCLAAAAVVHFRNRKKASRL